MEGQGPQVLAGREGSGLQVKVGIGVAPPPRLWPGTGISLPADPAPRSALSRVLWAVVKQGQFVIIVHGYLSHL